MKSKGSSERVFRLRIVKTVTDVCNVRIDEIAWTSRKKKIAEARIITINLLRDCLDLSWREIGEYLNIPYGTVRSAGYKAKDLLEVDYKFRIKVEYIKTLL